LAQARGCNHRSSSSCAGVLNRNSSGFNLHQQQQQLLLLLLMQLRL
jgi:hypothetical protein